MRKNRILTASMSTAAVLALALTACSNPTAPDAGDAGGAAKGKVVLGAPLALTGPSGSIGLDIQRGAELAVEQLNASGGIAGHQVELRVQDTTGDPAQAVQVTTSMARDEDVIAILGPVNAAELGAVTSIGESQKIVLFPPASSGAVPGVDNGQFNDWTFRVNQAIPLVVGPQMDSVIEETKAEKVTVLHYDDNAAYVDTGERWEAAAQADGATVTRLKFPSTTQDFSATVTSIPADTELIAIGALPATDAQLVRAIRQAGIEAPIMGDASMLSSEVFKGSRGGSEGAFAYSAYLPDQSDTSKKFTKDFAAKYDVDATAINAYGFDAVMMIAAGAGDGELSRESIRKGLSTLSDYEGASGDISYDGSGDAVRKSVPLVQIGDDGSLSQVGEIVPAEDY